MDNVIGVVSCHLDGLDAIERAFERAAGYGIGEIEWFNCHDFEDLYGRDIFRRIRALSEARGITSSLHAVCARGWDMGLVDEAEGRRILARQAAMAERVGAEKMTLHFGSYPGTNPCEETRAETLKRVVGLLGDFVPELERRGLRAGVENFVAYYSATTLGERVSDFDLLFSQVASEFIGLVLDTGHGNVTGDLAAYPAKFGSRLMHTHLHDNDGREDAHGVPGSGTIPWDSVLGGLAEIGYAGTLGLEFPEASGAYPAFIETLRMT